MCVFRAKVNTGGSSWNVSRCSDTLNAFSGGSFTKWTQKCMSSLHWDVKVLFVFCFFTSLFIVKVSLAKYVETSVDPCDS